MSKEDTGKAEEYIDRAKEDYWQDQIGLLINDMLGLDHDVIISEMKIAIKCVWISFLKPHWTNMWRKQSFIEMVKYILKMCRLTGDLWELTDVWLVWLTTNQCG